MSYLNDELRNLILSSLGRFKQRKEWAETFCPFCNDKNRKPNPKHGHLYINTVIPFFHCFRCSERGHILKLLNKIGIYDENIIRSIKKASGNYKFTSTVLVKSDEKDPYQIVEQLHLDFIKSRGFHLYQEFLNYVNSRSMDIDPIKYLLYPFVDDNLLYCGFYNYDNEHVNARVISISIDRRFKKIGKGKYYYWKDNLVSLPEYKDIVICESPFDAINLDRFYFFNLKERFVISIQNQFYFSNVKKIVKSFLLIGRYNVHVVFDKDYRYKERVIDECKQLKIINNKISFSFYTNVIGKDASDTLCIAKLEEV